MVLRGWREATIAPTTEKVSTMAEVRTKELAAPTLPYGSSRAVDLTIRANATPPTRSATESAHSDQASHEAARVLIPPIPRSCSVVPSVTAALYSSTVSQALRSQAVSELPRMPKRRSSQNGGSASSKSVGCRYVSKTFVFGTAPVVFIEFLETRGHRRYGGVFSRAPGSSFSSTIIEAAVATGFYASGLSLTEKPKKRKAGFSVHAPRNGQVVQRREGLWLHLT